MAMQKRKEPRWAAFQNKPFDFLLPSSQVTVKVKEPDMLTPIINGDITLDDSLFAMFAVETKRGMSDEDQSAQMMKQMNQSGSGGGIIDLVNMVCKSAFVEPRLVDNESDADYETTVPVTSISIVDRMAVFGRFSDMFNQLGDLQRFRTEANGNVQPSQTGEGLPSETE